MSLADNLKQLLAQQKNFTSELEREVHSLEANNLVAENDNLKVELEKYKMELEDAKRQNFELSEGNKGLKNSLYEQLYNEKIAILSAVNKKIDAYYQDNVSAEVNRLRQFELSSKHRINEMIETLRNNRVDSGDELYGQLEELNRTLVTKVSAAREELARQAGAYSKNKDADFEKLRQEGITENEMKSALKKNNIESLIGLNILNKLGILFLIIGVITAAQFTYFKLPDTVKGTFLFAGGAALLVVGELLNRKRANVFSLGITSGGVAILYSALAISYFGLKILDMYPAIGLCLIITALSFILSQRYNSQTIAAFALVGGYLPIFSIAGDKVLLFSAMGYFIVLNLLALIISFNKKWSVTAFIGFALNVMGTGYIMQLTLFDGRPRTGAVSTDDLITMAYILFAFVIYTLIPIMSTYKNKIKFNTADIILLGLNTFISAVLMYVVVYTVNLSDFAGVLAVAFAALYLMLGRFIETKLLKERRMQALFYLTGFTFVVLVIPFQFGKMWLSLGWLIEGVALVTYGILREEKSFKRYGYIASGLCLAAFLYVDILSGLGRFDILFAYKYFAITLGSAIIMSAYVYKKSLYGQGVLALKYATAINLWFFTLYIIGDKLSKIMSKALQGSAVNTGYLIAALSVAASFLIAYTIPRIKALSDMVMKVISIVIYVISILWLLLLNGTSSPVRFTGAPVPVTALGTLILVAIGLLSVLAMRDLVKCLVLERKLGIEWYPLVVSAYFVIILTQNLITQYQLEFSNLAISLIYVVTAFSWIVFGFIRRYAFIRRFGLGLSIMAVAKLFIVDLSFLSEGHRIVSYFAFGITLIAISFVYQYFNKRLDVKTEVITDA